MRTWLVSQAKHGDYLSREKYTNNCQQNTHISFSFEPLNKSSCVILGPETGSGFLSWTRATASRERNSVPFGHPQEHTHDTALFSPSWAGQMELQKSVIWRSPFPEAGQVWPPTSLSCLSWKPSQYIGQNTELQRGNSCHQLGPKSCLDATSSLLLSTQAGFLRSRFVTVAAVDVWRQGLSM